jgi:arabinofuranan 3-O-arabinosyltransferase
VPEVEVESSGRTKTKVRVTGATEPFWLVMGQSNNAGWRATVDGDERGESTLIEGYANGWLVRPGPSGDAIEATIEWIPQRTVNRAIALSILGALACIGILIGAAIRRRRRRGDDSVTAVKAEDDEAVLASPLVARGRNPGWVGTTVTTLLALVVGSIIVNPVVGVAFAIVVLLVLIKPRLRVLLSLAPAFFLAGCAAYIAAKQFHTKLPPTFEWPTFFWQVRTLGWMSILFLAGDALVEIVRRPRNEPKP